MMAYPGATIYLFSDTGVHEVDYEEIDHYKISKDFFSARIDVTYTVRMNLGRKLRVFVFGSLS